MDQPQGIPVMLTVSGRLCVVVGGGRTAARRAKALRDAGAQVRVIAPRIDDQITDLGIATEPRAFRPADLDGAFLVVIASDQPNVNAKADADARARGVLVNRADPAEQSDLAFMAAHRDGPLTLAVHTGGASASAAAHIRDELAEHLDAQWATLLRHAHAARQKIQATVTDPAKRLAMLRRLTDNVAWETLKTGGESALNELYADMMLGLE